VQIKGDVSITSHYGQSEIGGGATGNVALWVQGTDLTVGGELAVQSADAGAGANSGFVELATAQDVDQPSGSGPVSVSNIIVGGKHHARPCHVTKPTAHGIGLQASCSWNRATVAVRRAARAAPPVASS
jgi:hypothetical protein